MLSVYVFALYERKNELTYNRKYHAAVRPERSRRAGRIRFERMHGVARVIEAFAHGQPL